MPGFGGKFGNLSPWCNALVSWGERRNDTVVRQRSGRAAEPEGEERAGGSPKPEDLELQEGN